MIDRWSTFVLLLDVRQHGRELFLNPFNSFSVFCLNKKDPAWREKNETECKDTEVKKKDATLQTQTQEERKSKGCKMKTLAKVQERTEQLLGYKVDKVSVFIFQVK